MKLAQVELANGGVSLRAVGLAIHQETAGAADALPAVVIKGDGPLPAGDQTLVEHIQGFEQGEIGAQTLQVMAFQGPGARCRGLAPDLEGEGEGGCHQR